MTRTGFRLFAMLFALGAAAAATTIIPVSVEELARRSSHIVEARVLDSRSEWNPQHSIIYTYTRFQVNRSLRGPAPEIVTVKQLGGSAGGYTQHVSGVRQWNQGERAVLFLRPSATFDGTLEVTGFIQGSFRMTQSGNEVFVSNGVPGVSAFQGGSDATRHYEGARMTLRELETRVQKAVQ